jgi:hypothetical protein
MVENYRYNYKCKFRVYIIYQLKSRLIPLQRPLASRAVVLKIKMLVWSGMLFQEKKKEEKKRQ